MAKCPYWKRTFRQGVKPPTFRSLINPIPNLEYSRNNYGAWRSSANQFFSPKFVIIFDSLAKCPFPIRTFRHGELSVWKLVHLIGDGLLWRNVRFHPWRNVRFFIRTFRHRKQEISHKKFKIYKMSHFFWKKWVTVSITFLKCVIFYNVINVFKMGQRFLKYYISNIFIIYKIFNI